MNIMRLFQDLFAVQTDRVYSRVSSVTEETTVRVDMTKTPSYVVSSGHSQQTQGVKL